MAVLNRIKPYIDTFSIKLALILWGIIIILRPDRFHFEQTDLILYADIKILHFLYLYFIIYIIRKIIINSKNPVVKRGITVGIVYFFLVGLLLLTVWPGTWSCDDIIILYNTQTWDLSPWQHFFSGLFQIIFLQTMPFAAGIIIQQIFIGSLITGYCVSSISNIFGNTEKRKIIYSVILFIPTMLPPVLIYILSGFRMGLYSFFELLLITYLLNIYYKAEKIDITGGLKIIFLTVLISSWRTEAFYYPVFLCIILLIMGRKIISKKSCFSICVISMIICLIIGTVNNTLIGTNNYSIVSTLNPIVEIIRGMDEEDKKNELENVENILNIHMIYDYPDASGVDLYWIGGFVKIKPDEDYKSYMKSYIRLLIKYPKSGLRAMWDNFIKSTGIVLSENGKSEQLTNTEDAVKLYSSDSVVSEYTDKINSPLMKPLISKNLRIDMVNLLGCQKENHTPTVFYFFFYNVWIPLFIGIISCIYYLCCKKPVISLLIAAVICRTALIFISAVEKYFMYYLSIYLIMYFIGGMTIINIMENARKSKVTG